MDRNLKKALKCILESCGLEALHKINDDYIEFDKTKLCNQRWVKDINLPEENNDYVRMFVHLYRNNIDACTEYDESVAPSIDTITLQLALLGEVEKLVVKRHASLLIEAAGNQRRQFSQYDPKDNSYIPPVQMPDVPLMEDDLDPGEIPESRSTTISAGDDSDCGEIPEPGYTPINADDNLDCGEIPESKSTTISASDDLDCSEIPEPRLFTPLRINADNTEIN